LGVSANLSLGVVWAQSGCSADPLFVGSFGGFDLFFRRFTAEVCIGTSICTPRVRTTLQMHTIISTQRRLANVHLRVLGVYGQEPRDSCFAASGTASCDLSQGEGAYLALSVGTDFLCAASRQFALVPLVTVVFAKWSLPGVRFKICTSSKRAALHTYTTC
jgi:hypothetical protein